MVFALPSGPQACGVSWQRAPLLYLPYAPATMPPSPGAAGALYGTYEAFRYKVPGMLKVRYIGQTTLSSAAVRRLSWAGLGGCWPWAGLTGVPWQGCWRWGSR